MQIGAVAKKIGLSVDAIRFYERNALLPRPPRSQGGFRQYGENDVEPFPVEIIFSVLIFDGSNEVYIHTKCLRA
jgi:MerR-like DNA binding protein